MGEPQAALHALPGTGEGSSISDWSDPESECGACRPCRRDPMLMKLPGAVKDKHRGAAAVTSAGGGGRRPERGSVTQGREELAQEEPGQGKQGERNPDQEGNLNKGLPGAQRSCRNELRSHILRLGCSGRGRPVASSLRFRH